MTTPDLFTPPPTKYGYTLRHDTVLDWCIANSGACPFGCAKDGAPNCVYHVQRRECDPARR